MVTGEHRIVDMLEIDLVLCRRELGRGRVGRDVLRIAVGVKVVEEVFDFP